MGEEVAKDGCVFDLERVKLGYVSHGEIDRETECDHRWTTAEAMDMLDGNRKETERVILTAMADPWARYG